MILNEMDDQRCKSCNEMDYFNYRYYDANLCSDVMFKYRVRASMALS